MRYAEARNRIRSGDLLAWQGHGFESRIVRAFTGSSYSHVGIAWTVSGRVFVLEAALSGIRIFPLSQKPDFFWLPLRGAKWGMPAETWALSHVGEHYSRLEAIKGFLRLRLNNDTWQCAEYALGILARLGYDLTGIDATPEKLIAWAMRAGSRIELIERG